MKRNPGYKGSEIELECMCLIDFIKGFKDLIIFPVEEWINEL